MISSVFVTLEFCVAKSAHNPDTRYIDTELKELIDYYAIRFYHEFWEISLSQYKAWIALITLAEVGNLRYSAHSSYAPGVDRFEHKDVGAVFRFSTGIGAFQLDHGGEEGGEDWTRMRTLDKIDPKFSLLSTMRWHYNYFNDPLRETTLSDFSNARKWYAVAPENEAIFAEIWETITGSPWEECKDTRVDVEFHPPVTDHEPFNEIVQYIGKVYWDVRYPEGAGINWSGYFDTWLITARSYSPYYLEYQYYYTFRREAGEEIWVWAEDLTRIFEREYTITQYPKHRDGTVAGLTLLQPALDPQNHDSNSISEGLVWLRKHRAESPWPGNWSWRDNVGITSMCVLAFLNQGYTQDDPLVDKAIQYILEKQNPDGSFGELPTYETSTAIWALVATHNPKYHDEIEAARQYLETIQWDETEGIDESDARYGGFGYGPGVRPDLSNTQFALMALDAAYKELKLEKPSPADPSGWPYKAIKFVSRCQNRPASNDQEWAHDSSRPSYNDGGFIYYGQDGGVSLAGGTKSYGSMTAAGVWSLRLCGLPVGDGRIQAGLNWLTQNENGDFDDNPGHPYDEPHCFLYYYYMTIAKALAMCFVDKLTNGVDWYEALSAKLEDLQYEDGHWENASASHGWEHIPELATAYALLALQTRKPPPANLWMSIILASNADLHIYDPQGRHVGMNYDMGEIENEIPGASFEIDPQGRQIVSLRELEAGRYRIELVGTGTGDYSLTIEGYRDDQVTSTEIYEGTIQEGQTLVGNVTVASTLGELTLYLDTPQPVPSGLIAKAGDRIVDLSWDPYQVSGFDLAGYNVYRSTTKGTGYVQINPSLVTQTSYHDTGLTNGVTYYYVITAVDTDGNETDHSREVSATPFADTTPPPAPTITSPTHPDQDEWYSNNDPTFNWSEPDDPSGIAGYSFVLDQTADTTPDETIDTTECTKSYTDVADGIWYFHVRAVDGAGNWGPADHYRVKIRTVFPTAEITYPGDGAAIRGSVVIRGTASGDEFDYYIVEYGEGEEPRSWNTIYSSREPVTEGPLATWNTAQVPDGMYSIRLTVVDTYTYVVETVIRVLVDNTPPIIQDLLPIEGDFVPSRPTITATLTDNLSGIDEATILIRLNGDEVANPPSFDPETGKMTWTAQDPLPDGTYEVTIDVKDKAGNAAQQARTSFVILSELTIEDVLNYPNPCSSGTTFTYSLSREAHVRIEIYTLAGELIKVIDPASGRVGYNEQYWDGTDDQGYPLDNGVYIYLIIAEADGKVVRAIGRLVILR